MNSGEEEDARRELSLTMDWRLKPGYDLNEYIISRRPTEISVPLFEEKGFRRKKTVFVNSYDRDEMLMKERRSRRMSDSSFDTQADYMPTYYVAKPWNNGSRYK
jgi:hypothetical protein